REVDLLCRHPVGQHRSRQQERHAAGEALRQDDDLPPVAIDLEGLAPALPARRGRGLFEAQIRSLSAFSGRAPRWEMISAAAMPPMRAHSASGLPRVKPTRKPEA